MSTAYLVDRHDRKFALRPDKPTVVGRESGVDLLVDNESISRRHGTVAATEGTFFVTDLSSSNGIYINGSRLGTSPAALKDGDSIRFGSLDFTFHSEKIVQHRALCPNCGSPVRVGALFCTKCGHAQRASVASPVVGGMRQRPATPAVSGQSSVVAHRRPPVATIGLIFVISLVYLCQVLSAGSLEFDSRQLLAAGGLSYDSVVIDGQWYRILTSAALHLSLIHLLLNAYALAIFGAYFERRFGPALTFAVFALTAAAGSIVSLFALGFQLVLFSVSVGASGGVCGLIGAALAAAFTGAHPAEGRVRSWLLGNTLINIVPLYSGINYFDHFGGALCGFVFGLFALSVADHQPVVAKKALLKSQAPRSYAAAAQGVHYAGFWRRAMAAIVDGQALNVSVFLSMVLLGLQLPSLRLGADGTPIFIGSWLGSMVIGVLLGWLYFTLFESSALQATPGKLIFGARVTDLAERRIAFGRANARYWGKFLDVLTLAIGYLMAGWSRKRQALHDKLAETLVVLRPTTPSAGVQTLIVLAALVGGGIVTAGIRYSARPAPSLGEASASNASRPAVDTTSSQMSVQPAEDTACAKTYGELLGMGASAAQPHQDYAHDPVGTIKRMRTDFNSSVSQVGKIRACGDLTRAGCALVGMYNDPRIFGMSPDMTPAERRQFEDMQNRFASGLATCQRILGCDVVECSELQ
jgi:membrane associated rhomboid family serine protease/uncharacterized RDD family membrane protein YckC